MVSANLAHSSLNIQSGHRRFQLASHTAAVNCVCFSSSGDIAVTGSDDATLMVHDMTKGTLSMTLKGHTGPVVGCAVVGDTKDPIAVSASADGSVMVWRTSNGALLSTFSPTGKVAGALGILYVHTPKQSSVVTGRRVIFPVPLTPAIDL